MKVVTAFVAVLALLGAQESDAGRSRSCRSKLCGCEPSRRSSQASKDAYSACVCDHLWSETSVVFTSKDDLCNWCASYSPVPGAPDYDHDNGRRLDDDDDDDDKYEKNPLGKFCSCC